MRVVSELREPFISEISEGLKLKEMSLKYNFKPVRYISFVKFSYVLTTTGIEICGNAPTLSNQD